MLSQDPLPQTADGAIAQQDHERFLALINNMVDGFVAVDKNEVIVLSNGVALGLLDTNNLNGQRLSDALQLIDDKGSGVDIYGLITQHPTGIVSRDWRLKYKDGNIVNLYVSISPVRGRFGNEGQGGFVLLFRDITREKLVENERDEFISVASHELRTPVAIAEGSIGNALLLVQKSDGSPTVVEALETAHKQVIFLSNLINDLAMLSRADQGNAALSIEPFNVAGLVDSLLHDYQTQARQKGLKLEVKAADDLHTLSSNQLYVREILQNFITNALKYTEEGTITVTATARPNGTEFSVSDTGIGISKPEQQRLFSKFFRSEDWRVRKASGTGLGLYVSGKLAKLIGAAINLNSDLNKGSTFHIFVPHLRPNKSARAGISDAKTSLGKIS
ncbi:MAG: ATP-binding protein [Candidatus Saccharimonadales bacterium]